MITPIAGTTPLKPGSASFPFFGVKPVLINKIKKENVVIEGADKGSLCI